MIQRSLPVMTCILALALAACSTTKDVMAGAEGINRVSLNASDSDQGREQAIDEAKTYCKEKQKEAVFIDDKTKYKGSMDEDTRNTIKNASTAAILVGGMAQTGSWMNGDTGNDTGRVIGGAGGVGHVMTSGKDYNVEIKFQCR